MNAPRILPYALALAAAALSLGGAGALTSGCGTTGQQRVAFTAWVGGVERSDGPMRFTTSTGWSVTLTEARIAVGPVYLNTLEALTACAQPLRRFTELLAPTAWANGESHLGAGQVVGQVTRQMEVDALSPRLVEMSGGGDGLDVPARTADFWLYNMDVGALHGAAVRVAGVASRDDTTTVPFTGALVMDASLTTAQTPLDVARRVRGVPAVMMLSEGGALRVRVDPRGWFQGADFSELTTTATDAAGRHAFSLTDNVGRAFAASVRTTRGTFQLSFAEKEPPR